MDRLWRHRWMAGKYPHGTKRPLANIVVGVIGAVIGGFIMSAFGAQGFTGFNFTSMMVAVLGSVVLLFLAGLFRRA